MKELIGNTPMIKIIYRYLGEKRFLYAKLEQYNLTGSIKDRAAYQMIKDAEKEGKLKEDMTIYEATSGNMGISLSALGTLFHHPVKIYMPDWVSSERKQLIESYGGEVELVSKEEGGFSTCIKKANEMAKKNHGFFINQFANPSNMKVHYQETAEEILEKLPDVGGFVSGIGSGGTIMGIGKRFKEVNPNITIAALEPDTLPMLSCKEGRGSHKIEGIGDDFIPELVDPNLFDQIYLIHDMDAIQMSKMLANTLGLGVGISSGANFLAAVLLEDSLGTNIVTIFPDDHQKYLSTDLGKEIPMDQESISSTIELLDYEVI